MKEVCVVQHGSGIRLGSKVAVADSWWRRFRGLLGRPPLKNGEGLLLLECGAVHTVGMTRSIDVAFLGADGGVVRCMHHLGPCRIGMGGTETVHTLELPAGRLEGTGTVRGDRLIWS